MQNFFEITRVNKSEFARVALQRYMDEYPDVLENREEELEKELKDIKKQREFIEKKAIEKQNLVDNIAREFQQHQRYDHNDEPNLVWLEKRQAKLRRSGVFISLVELLEMCKKSI